MATSVSVLPVPVQEMLMLWVLRKSIHCSVQEKLAVLFTSSMHLRTFLALSSSSAVHHIDHTGITLPSHTLAMKKTHHLGTTLSTLKWFAKTCFDYSYISICYMWFFFFINCKYDTKTHCFLLLSVVCLHLKPTWPEKPFGWITEKINHWTAELPVKLLIKGPIVCICYQPLCHLCACRLQTCSMFIPMMVCLTEVCVCVSVCPMMRPAVGRVRVRMNQTALPAFLLLLSSLHTCCHSLILCLYVMCCL